MGCGLTQIGPMVANGKVRMNAMRIALNAGSLVLVAVLGWLAVRVGLGIFQPESLYAPAPIVVPTQTLSGRAALVSYDFSTDPFAFGEITAAPIEFIEDAPETTLNLKLIGIVSESNATFRLPDGTNKAVKIGDEVMNGVTLTRTAKDFVTLDVNGEAQKLTLERVKLGEKESAPRIARAIQDNTAGSKVPSQAEIEKIFSQLTLSPQRELLPDKTSRIKGFHVKARPGADLSKLGLKSGDVITRFGPVALNSSQVNFKEIRDLASSGGVQDYEVIRNGAPVTIRLGQ